MEAWGRLEAALVVGPLGGGVRYSETLYIAT